MLHGVKNISYDRQGYIYWKGQEVEHFNCPTASNMANPTKELERRCKILEARRVAVNASSVIWKWDESGNGDKWEIAFHDCKASKEAQNAARRICTAYAISGLCDPAYIANVIQTETDKV